MWEEKGSRLDKILQLRLFESESEKLRSWLVYEVGQLAQAHTDIGDSPSTALLRKASFNDYKSKLKVSITSYCMSLVYSGAPIKDTPE